MRKNRILVCFVAIFLLFIVNFAFFSFMHNNECVAVDNEKMTDARAMMVVERSTGRKIFSFNEHEKLAMASTTKIITAIYVIEHCEDLNKVVQIPKSATKISGTSIGLVEGEHLTMRELLYGLMLRSGNDSAVALAIATSGSEEQFVSDVNNFLQEKGFVETHICNPHGLTEKEHYTTASDLAKITAYAMNNETFREIVSTKEMKISNELNSKYNRNLKNKNKLLSNYEGADGVKTGFTMKAGRCFVGSATRNNMQLICVLLNCVPMFEDCEMLLDKGFDMYQKCNLIEKGKQYFVETTNGRKAFVSDIDFSYPLSKQEKQNISLKIVTGDENQTNENGQSCLAEMQIYLENQLIFSHKIYNINTIENNGSIADNIQKIVKEM